MGGLVLVDLFIDASLEPLTSPPKEIIVFALLLLVLFILPDIKSFSRFTMTEEGIGNKYLFYKWEDVEDYKEFEFTFNKFRFPQFNVSIIYFGEELVNSYRELNPKRHIFFEDTPKNVEMLKRFMQPRNEKSILNSVDRTQ